MAAACPPSGSAESPMAQSLREHEALVREMLERHHRSLLLAIDQRHQPYLDNQSEMVRLRQKQSYQSLDSALDADAVGQFELSPKVSSSSLYVVDPLGSLTRTESGEVEGTLETVRAAESRLTKAENEFTKFKKWETEEKWVSKVHKFADKICQHRFFEPLIAFAVVANSALIGLEASYSMKHGADKSLVWFNIGGSLFAAVFFAEISIRWFTQGISFVRPSNPDFTWNLFDMVLVVSAIMEEMLELFKLDILLNISFIRLARLFRLVRILRMFKVMRSFKELRIMVLGILNCGKPLCWAVVLLALMSYMYMVFMLQVYVDWRSTLPLESHDSNYPRQTVAFVETNFSTPQRGMYTLFKCISGGIDWQEIADPLLEISYICVVVFVVYILFTMFCVLNLITALFLQAANRKNELVHIIHEKQDFIAAAKAFYSVELAGAHDPGDDVTVTEVCKADFVTFAQSARTRAFFEQYGLDLYFESPEEVFQLMDRDGNGVIDMDEFVGGLYRLKGNARSLHVQLELQRAIKKIDHLGKKVAQLEAASDRPADDNNILGSSSFSRGSPLSRKEDAMFGVLPSTRARTLQPTNDRSFIRRFVL